VEAVADEPRAGQGQVVDVIGQAAGVLEQLTDGDQTAVVAVAPHEPGEVALDRGVQLNPVAGDQLQHHGGYEGLRRAADTELAIARHGLVATELSNPAHAHPAVATCVADLDECAGEAITVGQHIERLLHARVAFGRGPCGR